MEKYLPLLIEKATLYLPKILLALITLIVGFWLANKIASFVAKTMRKRGADETVVPFMMSIITVLLKVMVLISVAGMFGVETTSFIALIGAAGLAVGLALQGSLAHFASGVMILVFRPYKVGDLVSIAGFTGVVDSITVFNTVLRTPDNKHIIIPNGSVTAGPITNISGQGTIRVDMQFAVSAAEDLDKVRKVIQQVASSSPLILKNPPIDILVNGHEIGITKFDVRPWCMSEHYWDVYYYMQENVKKHFVSNGVLAPKPAMDLNVNNAN
ncbi:MAG: mechanosensitive ion channel [Saprospiraceae bacterium]|nr:mechanosensitive ion channel [Saprospiraceae bacterium]